MFMFDICLTFGVGNEFSLSLYIYIYIYIYICIEIVIYIYLDLSKTFDTLDHEVLLHKLQYYGLKQTALKLFNKQDTVLLMM